MKKLRLSLVIFAVFILPLTPASAQDWVLSTEVGANVQVKAIAAADDENVWAGAGGYFTYHNGEIYFFDGSSWSLQTVIYPGNSGRHQGGYAFSADKAYMVGYDEQSPKRGRVYSYYAGQWRSMTEITTGSNVYLYDVYAPNYNVAWVTGNSGKIFRAAGGGLFWYEDTDTGSQFWNGIHGLDNNNIWIVGGESGAVTPSSILYYNGSNWTIQTTITLGSSKWLRDVVAIGVDDVWVAGDTGLILHYDGSSWSVVTDVGESNDSAPITARAPKNVWAGMGGTAESIYFYNGSDWTAQTDLGDDVYSLDASALYRVWAGGADGKIWSLDLPSTRGRYDYNGDGTSDIAIFRGSSGMWAVRDFTRAYFGTAADEPAPADYNGDGTTDIGIFRDSIGLWAVRDLTRVYFGQSLDSPHPGDYDGDGLDDFCIFRETSGFWAVRDVTRVYFGSSGDDPAPGYYDGDNFEDIGIFRSGLWAVRDLTRIYFGAAGDRPVPGDFWGDDSWNAAIYRPISGLWSVRYITRAYFGTGSDYSRQADYDGNGTDDLGIFRATNGLWAVHDLTRLYFGTYGDVPVTR